jgi:hypothetical protein
MTKLLLVAIVAIAGACGAAEPDSPAPVLSEKLRDTSPNGKFVLQIKYDGALNDSMRTNETPPRGEIFSHAIKSITIVSLPNRQRVRDLTDVVTEGGIQFDELMLLWSADSKWFALHHQYPRVGYTNVFHLRGTKFELTHKVYELEDHRPLRWIKPGILELGVTEMPGPIATFDGKGAFKLTKKRR